MHLPSASLYAGTFTSVAGQLKHPYSPSAPQLIQVEWHIPQTSGSSILNSPVVQFSIKHRPAIPSYNGCLSEPTGQARHNYLPTPLHLIQLESQSRHAVPFQNLLVSHGITH